MLRRERITYPEWIEAEPNPRKRIELIFDAMVRCMTSEHMSSPGSSCGPHMTAVMGQIFVLQIIDDMLAIQER